MTRWHKPAGLRPLVILPAVLLSWWWCGAASAAPVTAERAHKLTGAWVAAHPRPMNSRLGSQIDSVETFTDANGQPIYYIVYLRPNGFVIASADDLVEPIIGFASAGSYDPSDRNPLGALVSRDLPARVNAARAVERKMRSRGGAMGLTQQEAAIRRSGEDAFGKWEKLTSEANSSSVLMTSAGSISDVRVSPLLLSQWSQTTVCSNACYNYYTPKYGEGDSNNYPSGCVATAMAQYMRFWQYPTTGVGTGCFTIYVDGSAQTWCLRGGDDSGGAYDWLQMVLDPNCSTTLAQRQAIGALTYDAGVAVHMQYTSSNSGAYMSYVNTAMVNTFHYSNAIFGYNYEYNIGAGLNAMINPNLDWGNPVILGIDGSAGGHAIVADGYGYNVATLYHHLNLGWAGTSDAWYNLPNIDSSPYSFSVVDSAIYNIFINSSGEIISGRVMDTNSGLPISGATVTAIKTGGGTYQAATSTNGIYAVAKVPSNSTYTVSAAKTGYHLFTSQVVSTGLSSDDQPTSGNCWAVDLTGTAMSPIPVASDSNVTAEAGKPQMITLQAIDDGEPNPPGAITCIITSLPHHGTLADPCVGSIDTVPYSLANYGNNVIYTPLVCYTGSDSFQFLANDGGTLPTGGDSNIAAISITVQPPSPQVIYETHFDTGLPAGWTIVNGGSSSDTWRSDNPRHRTNSNWTGVFMIVDSDYAGTANMNEELITHSINCAGLTNVKLRFKHYFRRWSTEIGDVDICVNGGTWQNVARYQGADSNGLMELALSSFGADGDPNVQIRWHYYNANYENYWGIDDVQIVADAAGQTSLVGDFDSDCDVDYDDLVIFTSAWLTDSGQPNWNPACDIAEPNDGVINGFDYAVFAGNWMVGK